MPRLFAAYDDRLLRVEGRADDWTAERVLSGPDLESVAGHPDGPDVVFAGTFDRGLQRSDDGGDTWSRVGEGTIASDSVTAVAVDPSDPAVVYAGTEPSRVYRSTDGGDSWTHRDGLVELPSASRWSFPPRPHTHHVRWIEVDPTDADHLYVSIEAGALVQSTDAGATWTDRVPSSTRDTHSLTTHPDAPGSAWAAAGDGFAVTADGGDTWAQPMDGLTVGYCWSVAVDPGDPGTVLLSAASGPRSAHRPDSATSYLFRRRGDAAWEPLGDRFPDGEGVLRPVLARGHDPGAVFAASNRGCYRTADAGDSWRPLDLVWDPELERQAPSGLVVLP